MKHPRWNTAVSVLLRGFLFLLFSAPLFSQPVSSAFSVAAGYLEGSQIFLHPQSPDPEQRQRTTDIGGAYSVSASYRYRLYSPIALQLRAEYVSTTGENVDQVGTRIRNGYSVWQIEGDATFSLPFSTERFDVYVGGGVGVYLGEREYAVADVEAETVSAVPAFGIHLVIGAEYLLTEQLGVRSEVLFRDPQITVENRFSRSSVTSNGVVYPLQDTDFLSHINLNGNVYALGLSWHF